ncbi:MAG: L-rhamnose mutarotase [Bacteroidales bacterium]
MSEGKKVFGSIIKLKPEYEERYKALHRNTFPGVLSRIRKSNVSDYSIFLDGGILFSHMIHGGADFHSDMSDMAGDEVTRDWWLLTDPMQEPMEGCREGEWWASLEMILLFEPDQGHSHAAKRLALIAEENAAIHGVIQKLQEELSPDKYPGVGMLKIFRGYGNLFIYLEVAEAPVTGLDHHIPGLNALFESARQMKEVFHTDSLKPDPQQQKKVFVSGCFDMLHSGHIAFLEEAAQYGNLFVCIGSDATIAQLKGRYPVNSEHERKYLLEAQRSVYCCLVNSGSGIIDFEAELNMIQPDVFIVNEDGHTPVKEALCARAGIEYKVLKRIPHTGLPTRSTTLLRTECAIPFRIDLAGGWLDQPYVSRYCPGSVLTISIEPTVEFNDRSGMASSTRRKAIELWRNELPHGDAEHFAKILFSFENPPGTSIIAGSQDALGIVLPGLNKLHYSGAYWPDEITGFQDEETFGWLERHLYLVTLGPRVKQYDVLANTDITEEKAHALAKAADDCWSAILSKELNLLGNAFRHSFEAQVAMFPNMADEEIYRTIAHYRERALGWKLSGAGGGGYLIMVAEDPIPGAMQIRIRRKNNL